MKKLGKYLFGFAVVFLLALGFSGKVDAAVIDSGSCGDVNVNDGKDVTWKYTDDKILTISGNGTMMDINNGKLGTPAPWQQYSQDITTVVIEDGVKDIGTNAFWRCQNLISVTIPESVTIIGKSAFAACIKLQSITIPASVTELGEKIFNGCTSLTDINFEGSNEEWNAIEGIAGGKALEGVNVNVHFGLTYTKVEATKLRLKKTSLKVTKGKLASIELKTRIPEDADVFFKSSNDSIATVNPRGQVTGHMAGKVKITAYGRNDKVKAVCNVTVVGPVAVKSVKPSKSSLTLQQGTGKVLTPKYSPAKAVEGKAVTWTSDDPSIATVDENGYVTAVSEGKTYIRVTPAVGKAGKCKVTVKGPLKVKRVKPSKTSLKLAPGEGRALTPKYSPAKAVIGTKVTWTSDDPAIAKVDDNGNVTAVAAGVTYIRVKPEIGKEGKCKVTVK